METYGGGDLARIADRFDDVGQRPDIVFKHESTGGSRRATAV
jgi:hypothetical protein